MTTRKFIRTLVISCALAPTLAPLAYALSPVRDPDENRPKPGVILRSGDSCPPAYPGSAAGPGPSCYQEFTSRDTENGSACYYIGFPSQTPERRSAGATCLQVFTNKPYCCDLSGPPPRVAPAQKSTFEVVNHNNGCGPDGRMCAVRFSAKPNFRPGDACTPNPAGSERRLSTPPDAICTMAFHSFCCLKIANDPGYQPPSRKQGASTTRTTNPTPPDHPSIGTPPAAPPTVAVNRVTTADPKCEDNGFKLSRGAKFENNQGSCRIALFMAGSGALRIDKDGSRYHVVNQGKSGGPGSRLIFSATGNLVIQGSDGKQKWTSQTAGQGYNKMCLYSDGRLTLEGGGGRQRVLHGAIPGC